MDNINRLDIINTYKKNKSIKGTSRITGISHQTVRRILMQERLYWNPRLEEITRRFENGETRDEIADALGVSVKTVSAYLPYSRGTYALGEKSDNAKRIASWRESRSAKVAEGVKKSL